jgi:hypothetical protein
MAGCHAQKQRQARLQRACLECDNPQSGQWQHHRLSQLARSAADFGGLQHHCQEVVMSAYSVFIDQQSAGWRFDGSAASGTPPTSGAFRGGQVH